MTTIRPHANARHRLTQFVATLIAVVLFGAQLCAQQPVAKPVRPAAKPAEPILETLLSDDSYKVYGEVRNVGQLLSTGGAGEIIEPIMKLADPPREFTALVKFLNANTETLAASRLMFATWPARAGIPNALVVIELASAEEAVKFEPKLNRLLPLILPTPTPTPTPAPTPTPTVIDEKTASVAQETPTPAASTPQAPQKTDRETQSQPSVAMASPLPVLSPLPMAPPFVVSRSGNLIFVTDKAFKFERLRPAGSKLLSEDQNFRLAHDRFSTESIFIYVNVALEDKTKPKPPTAEEIAAEEEQGRIKAEAEAANNPKPTEVTASESPTSSPEPDSDDSPDDPASTVTMDPVLGTPPSEPTPTPNPSQQLQMAAYSSFGTIFGLLGSGEPEWPDAVGLAISQESDDYVIRAILLGPENGKRLPLPFVPQLLAGRSYTPNAPSVLPDDTEIFVTASLDLPKTYEGLLKQSEKRYADEEVAMRKLPAAQRKVFEKVRGEALKDPFAAFEAKAGFKINEELLPALGNEIAIGGSLKSMQAIDPIGLRPPTSASAKPSPETEEAKKKEEEQASPVLVISIKDREAARRLMPKVLDGLGVGEANLVAHPERKDDTELVDFAGAFAYAFVGDFLIISTTATARHVIDSYLNHQTLSSNNAFRNFTRWQPRDMLGQIYISPAMMESYTKAAHDPSQQIPASMRDYLMRLNPTPQAITYALSNEGFGAIHELHLPKTFILASVAGAASATKEPPPEMNEAIAIGLLHAIVSAEATYQSTEGNGSYGSLDKLIEMKLVSKEMLDKYGYSIAVTASGDQFEATATPVEYGKTGRRSFFVDQTGVIRGDDHGGAPANAADKPAQ